MAIFHRLHRQYLICQSKSNELNQQYNISSNIMFGLGHNKDHQANSPSSQEQLQQGSILFQKQYCKQLLSKFQKKVQQSYMSGEAKNFVRNTVLKGRQIESKEYLVIFFRTSIDILPQTQRKIAIECWQQAQQQTKQPQKAAQSNKQKAVVKQGEQKVDQEDSFKFDSHSQSHSSSYDDIDDDFRKEQMHQQEHQP